MDRSSILKCILYCYTEHLSHFEIGIPFSKYVACSYPIWGHLNGAKCSQALRQLLLHIHWAWSTCFGKRALPERLNVRFIRILTHRVAFLQSLYLLNIKTFSVVLIHASLERLAHLLYRRIESQPCRIRKILTLCDPVPLLYKHTLTTAKSGLSLKWGQRS